MDNLAQSKLAQYGMMLNFAIDINILINKTFIAIF